MYTISLYIEEVIGNYQLQLRIYFYFLYSNLKEKVIHGHPEIDNTSNC